ncbi:SDR family NAD(P)-dependent oxidoreductase [Pelagibacterium limicola]|uniref:SDR family NAD(P)-dependent oxidoreductase n=1 Tax=Pelagibacterium limicola TaxID=2791022 RepID=UPI0018AF5F6F|nr:SDR family oxidoreductase [Pelagibacterium limicola]
MDGYAGRKCVIVGGTHGMGLAVARRLVDGGAEVIVTGRNPENVAKAAQTLGRRAHAVAADITRMADIEALAEAVNKTFGAADFVFANAGIGIFELFEAVNEATYDRYFATNAKGIFFAAQRLAPLVRNGGSFVFTTVTPGNASPGLAVYAGTKAAVKAFARTMAVELLPRDIRVNMVAPGFIDTPTLGIADATPEERAEIHAIGDAATPMKRHGTPDEVASAVLFLAFDATFTTGVELPVDGGISQMDAPMGTEA